MTSIENSNNPHRKLVQKPLSTFFSQRKNSERIQLTNKKNFNSIKENTNKLDDFGKYVRCKNLLNKTAPCITRKNEKLKKAKVKTLAKSLTIKRSNNEKVGDTNSINLRTKDRKIRKRATQVKSFKSPDSVMKTFNSKRTSALPEIKPEVLARMLNNKFSECYEKLVVVDCRFQYEYDGGHIKGAINVNTEEKIKKLYDSCRSNSSKNTVFVFHCEFSSQRAPRLAKSFRQLDRLNNDYPNLSFPLVFVLSGGYKSFYKYSKQCIEFFRLCEPFGYVSMFDANAKSEYETKLKCSNKLKFDINDE